MTKYKKMIISLVLGTSVSVGAFYLAFRNVPFAELANYITLINYWWILPSVSVLMLSFALRAVRWQIILNTTCETGDQTREEIHFWSAFHPLIIGFMLNCILPGRVGEVARPVILQQKNKVPFSTGIATVAAERVLDICVLITFFAILFATVRIDPGIDIPFGEYHLNKETLESIGNGMIKLCIVLIFGIIMLSFSRSRELINGGIMGIPYVFFFVSSNSKEKIKEKVCVPVTNFVNNFAIGFELVKFPKKIIMCIVLSLLIWISSALSYYIMSLGCPGIGLSFMEITAVMIIICFFIALPSVPGFWGIWEAGGVFALALFGVASKDVAGGFTLANHAVQLFPVVIIGFVSAAITGVNIWNVSCQPPRSEGRGLQKPG